MPDSDAVPADIAGILDGLTVQGGTRGAALRHATACWDACRPVMHGLLRSYLDGDRSERSAELSFHAVYLMAQQRDATGFPLVCALARDAAAAEDVLGDGLIEDLDSILVRLFDGDASGLHAVIEDDNADEMARSAACDALAWLTAAGRIDRAETSRYLAGLATTLEAAAGSFAWVGWQQAIASLALVELAPLAEAAFARGLIDPGIMGLEHFRADLQAAGAATDPMLPFDDRFRSMTEFDDVAAMMEAWAANEPAPQPRREPAWPRSAGGEPQRNPLRHVGRNDPCPCGSGRKFKKCCLGKDSAG